MLPVVARKMGLEDQYEEANGLPQPKRRLSEEMIPPVRFLRVYIIIFFIEVRDLFRLLGHLATIQVSVDRDEIKMATRSFLWMSSGRCRKLWSAPSLLQLKTMQKLCRSLPRSLQTRDLRVLAGENHLPLHLHRSRTTPATL